MTAQKFSKGEAVRFGWETMKANFWFFAGLLIALILIQIVNNIFVKPVKKIEDITLIWIILALIFWFLGLIIQMGMLKIVLKFCDGQKRAFSDLLVFFPHNSQNLTLFLNYLAGSILYVLIIIAGLILLIVPGLIWAIKFSFFGYLIVDKKLGPIEALKKSSKITRAAKWDLSVFWTLLFGIILLGFLALIVGLFAALPTVMIAQAFVYRKLLAQTETAQTV